jgi:hypothetical protein
MDYLGRVLPAHWLEHEHFDFSRYAVALMEHREMARANPYQSAMAKPLVSGVDFSPRRRIDLVGCSELNSKD